MFLGTVGLFSRLADVVGSLERSWEAMFIIVDSTV